MSLKRVVLFLAVCCSIKTSAMPQSCERVLHGPIFGSMEKDATYFERPGAYGILLDARGKVAVVATPHGFFLPGGGLDPGESAEHGLRRELLEELGLTLQSSRLLSHAVQYRWSPFYQKHFRKSGKFFSITVAAGQTNPLEVDHDLLWWSPAKAEQELSEEYQRWAIAQLKK